MSTNPTPTAETRPNPLVAVLDRLDDYAAQLQSAYNTIKEGALDGETVNLGKVGTGLAMLDANIFLIKQFLSFLRTQESFAGTIPTFANNPNF